MERAAVAETILRPLGIGEMLDRAVSLCVRSWVPLAAIATVYTVPHAVMQFFARSSFGRSVIVALTDIRLHGAMQRHADDGSSGWTFLIDILLCTLATGALIAMIGPPYLGRAPSVRQAYGMAIGRILPLATMTAGVYVSILVFFVVACVIAIGSARGLPPAFSVPIVVLMVLGFLSDTASALVVLLIAEVTCVIEAASPAQAIKSTAARLRKQFRRSLLFGFAYVALIVAYCALVTIAEIAIPFLHGQLAAVLFESILETIYFIITTAFGCIYYSDLRVRDEAFDLTSVAGETLGSPALRTP